MKLKKLNFSKIEKKWQKYWQDKAIYEPDFFKAKKPFYNLMMFPYPSAEGLHVGNMYAFTGSDIYGRYKRMQGYDVFEPIGLDGFGIHSENYALKINRHPKIQAKISQKRFYKQLEMIGNSFAFKERLETYDPNYYRFTQYLFILMFKNGLAYRKKAPVNWCISCKTVLADEQIINGKCERCNSEVVRKELEQWFFKITKYADKLLKNLEKIDWTEKVKINQKNWIGKSEGAEISFNLKNLNEKINVFTTRLDTIFGVTYLVLAPEHPLVLKLKDKILNFKEVLAYIENNKFKTEEERLTLEKTGVELKGIKAINPINQEEISVWVSDYVLLDYGTGAIMAVPAHDQRDFEFALKYNLKIKTVISPEKGKLDFEVKEKAFEFDGYLINSAEFTNLTSQEARVKILKKIKGKRKVIYHLRDWLISRQRYWGAPIPMIYCKHCALEKRGERKDMPGWYCEKEENLPVVLPYIKNFRPTGTGQAPLASVKSFYKTKCPNCQKEARRETDVCDTFLDSSWYYLGYLLKVFNWSVKITDKKFKDLVKKWLPVDMYIGGAEHSVLHLLYVRFIAMALKDLKLVHFQEPFLKFRAHGLLIKEGAKMSKSKGNVVNPDEYIKKFGADTLRMYLMFLAPFEEGGDFRDAGILGIKRFLERVWKYYQVVKIENLKPERNLLILVHQTIKKVSDDIENLHYNTAISALMILFNQLEKRNKINFEILEIFLKLLAPFAPHLTEELWHNKLNLKNSIHLASWPKYNLKLVELKEVLIIIQVNGKVKDKINVLKGIKQKDLEELVLKREKIKKIINNKQIKKVIYVPDRVINFVI